MVKWAVDPLLRSSPLTSSWSVGWQCCWLLDLHWRSERHEGTEECVFNWLSLPTFLFIEGKLVRIIVLKGTVHLEIYIYIYLFIYTFILGPLVLLVNPNAQFTSSFWCFDVCLLLNIMEITFWCLKYKIQNKTKNTNPKSLFLQVLILKFWVCLFKYSAIPWHWKYLIHNLSANHSITRNTNHP